MKKIILLPDLGEGIERVDVSEIPVKVGQKISNDTIIIVLESDKATMEIPSEYSGTITNIFALEKSSLSMGDRILEIDIKNVKDLPVKVESEPKRKNQVEKSSPKKLSFNNNYNRESITNKKSIASPGVRKICRELNIDINNIASSTNDGRISRADLYSYTVSYTHLRAHET